MLWGICVRFGVLSGYSLLLSKLLILLIFLSLKSNNKQINRIKEHQSGKYIYLKDMYSYRVTGLVLFIVSR